MKIPCITLWQPWGSLIVYLDKRCENRSWAFPEYLLGKRIAIHAGMTFDGKPIDWEDDDDFSRLTKEQQAVKGAVLGTVRLCGLLNPDGDIVSWIRNTHIDNSYYKYWESGQYGWLMDRVTAFPIPVKAKGQQGIWQWEVPAELEYVV